MSDDYNQTVYITKFRKVYHTDRGCQGLRRANDYHERQLSTLYDDMPICKRCSGSTSTKMPSNHLETVQLLQAMDPGEI